MKIPRLFANLTLISALTLTGFSALISTGCSSIETRDVSTPEGAYQSAEDFEKDERYEEAIAKYTDVKNKFPYSRFATLADLKIADIQFKQEN